MNFLGLGPGELMLIAVLGLVVFGPGKLPEIAGQIGKAVRDFRQSTTEITSEFQRSFSIEELTATSNGSTTALESDTTATQDSPTAPNAADATAWSWEEPSLEPASYTVSSSSGSGNGASSFWDWDETSNEGTIGQPTASPQVSASGMWEWDASGPESAAAPEQRKPSGAA